MDESCNGWLCGNNQLTIPACMHEHTIRTYTTQHTATAIDKYITDYSRFFCVGIATVRSCPWLPGFAVENIDS